MLEWTPEITALAKKRFDQGVRSNAIADEINNLLGVKGQVTGGAVRNFLRRNHRNAVAAVAQANRERTERGDDRIAQMVRAGHSASEIARELGVSIHVVYNRAPSGAFAENMRAKPFGMRGTLEEWLDRCKVTPVEDDPVTEAGKSFLELGERECRWPIGKDADGAFRFCGCPKHAPRASYCAEHYAASTRQQDEAEAARAKARGKAIHSFDLAMNGPHLSRAERMVLRRKEREAA